MSYCADRGADDMADIFISYSKADRTLVLRLSSYLEAEGWKVWWDKSLSAGDEFRDEIMKQIASARGDRRLDREQRQIEMGTGRSRRGGPVQETDLHQIAEPATRRHSAAVRGAAYRECGRSRNCPCGCCC